MPPDQISQLLTDAPAEEREAGVPDRSLVVAPVAAHGREPELARHAGHAPRSLRREGAMLGGRLRWWNGGGDC